MCHIFEWMLKLKYTYYTQFTWIAFICFYSNVIVNLCQTHNTHTHKPICIDGRRLKWCSRWSLAPSESIQWAYLSGMFAIIETHLKLDFAELKCYSLRKLASTKMNANRCLRQMNGNLNILNWSDVLWVLRINALFIYAHTLHERQATLKTRKQKKWQKREK